MQITTYFGGLDEFARLLNMADVKGAKLLVKKLGKEANVETWEAHQLIARACAKFHYDKWTALDLQDFQFKFYSYANLNDVTDDIIDRHLRHNECQKQNAIALAKSIKQKHLDDDRKRREAEAVNAHF